MRHKLAKELKEAGFPYIQKKVAFDLYDKVWDYIPSEGEPMETDPQLVPTLSELVSACGKDFFFVSLLIKGEKEKYGGEEYDKPWGAKGHVSSTEKFTEMLLGDTPEEAVASLWIRLNKPAQ